LADKLDTLAAFYIVQEKPTGSKDPFALRRAAISVISLITKGGLRLPLRAAFMEAGRTALATYAGRLERKRADALAKAVFDIGLASEEEALEQYREEVLLPKLDDPAFGEAAWELVDVAMRDLLDFFADRLKVQQREAGVRHDLIDAVFALGGEDDLVRLLARVHALQAFVGTEDGANLLAGYKRAANILKKEGFVAPAEERRVDHAPHGQGSSGGRSDPTLAAAFVATGSPDNPTAPASAGATLSYAPEPAEAALIAALDSASPQAASAVEAEDFEAAMAALATLRAPIDRFFDDVTVNDLDPAKREARLALLARVRDAVHAVADFSKIEG